MIFLSLGTNLGNRIKNLKEAILLIENSNKMAAYFSVPKSTMWIDSIGVDESGLEVSKFKFNWSILLKK